MAYEKQTWQNNPPSTATPITAERLDHLETQYDEALAQVAVDIADPDSDIGTELNATIGEAVFDPAYSAPSLIPAAPGVNALDVSTGWNAGAVERDASGEAHLKLTVATASTQVQSNHPLVASLRRKVLSFELMVDANYDSLYLRFAAAGDDFNNGFDTTGTPAGRTSVIGDNALVGKWVPVSFTPAQLTPMGTATWDQLDDIRRVRVQAFSNASGGSEFKVRRFRLHDQPVPPGIIWRFDDGWSSTFTKAFPVLGAHGHVGTVPLEVSRIGVHPERMTLAQVKSLDAAGWEMVNHTLDGGQLAPLTSEQIREQIIGGYEWLIHNGFARGARHLCYPGGSVSTEVIGIAQRYCKTGWKNGGARAETPGTGDPMMIQTYQFLASTTAAQVKGWMDKVKAQGGVMMLMLHDVVDSGATSDKVLTATLNEVAQHATTIGLPSYTPSQVWGS